MNKSLALVHLYQKTKLKYSLTDYDVPQYIIFQEKVLYIWTGASSMTIYPKPWMNWLFRAHHDTMHRKTRLGFSFDEEVAVTKEGIYTLGLLTSPQLANLYWADNVGQQEYLYATGKFPEDQRGFVEAYLGGTWKNNLTVTRSHHATRKEERSRC